MLIVAILAVGLVFVGSQLVDRGRQVSAVADATKESLGEVTDALRQATANVQDPGSPQETAWQREANAVCAKQSAAVDRGPWGLGSDPEDPHGRYGSPAGSHGRLTAKSPPSITTTPPRANGWMLLRGRWVEGQIARPVMAGRIVPSTG